MLGGPLSIDDARQLIVLAPRHQLLEMPQDGSCFYHSVVAATADRYGNSPWTVPQLRSLADQRDPDSWAEEHHILYLADLLDIKFCIVPCELRTNNIDVRYDLAINHGPDGGATVELLWWTHNGAGLHFDLLRTEDDLTDLTYQQLARRCTSQGHYPLSHHMALHLRHALRHVHHPATGQYPVGVERATESGAETNLPITAGMTLSPEQKAMIEVKRRHAMKIRALRQPFSLPTLSPSHLPPPPLPIPVTFYLQAFHAPTCSMLQDANPNRRDSRITFEAESHTYTVDGLQTLGSVTGLVHCFSMPFDEDEVIAKMRGGRNWPRPGYLRHPAPSAVLGMLCAHKTKDARDLLCMLRDDVVVDEMHLFDAVKAFSACHPEVGHKIMQALTMDEVDIKRKWAYNREDASCRGTWMHLQFEMYLNAMPSDLDNPEGRLLLRYLSTLRGYTAYRTEWQIYAEDLRLAGSIDFIAMKADGTVLLVDWKRSKGLSHKYSNTFGQMTGDLRHLPDAQGVHYRLQLNLYRHILQKYYGMRVSDMMVVCCHPELSEPFVDHVPVMDGEVRTLLLAQARAVAEADGAVSCVVRPAPKPKKKTCAIRLRMPSGKRIMVDCPLSDSAKSLYKWVSARLDIELGSFTVEHGGNRITRGWLPRSGMEVVVSMRPRTRGTLGRCSALNMGSPCCGRRRRTPDSPSSWPSPCRRRSTSPVQPTYVRVLLDSGAEAHICPPSFRGLFARDDIIDHTDGNMDAHGNPITYQGHGLYASKPACLSIHYI